MRCFDTEAGDVELDDDTVVYQSVDGSDSGHCVLEDLIPFAGAHKKVSGTENVVFTVNGS